MSSEATDCSQKLQEFLPYELDFVPDDLRKRARTELFEDEETRIHSLRLLRSMLRDESDLNYPDDDLFLLSFLRARKFDVKRALNMMRVFYKEKEKRSELYDNFKFEDVKRTLEENTIGFLPYRDSEGCVIIVIRVEPWKPEVNSMGDIMRVLTTAILHAILSPATQIAGFKVIFDFKGFSKYHLPYVSPTYLWLLAEAIQNGFPGRFRAIHFVNETSVLSYIWPVLRHFLKKKMRDRFHFHGKNVKKLHKYFSPRILPAEYEGELPPFDGTEWRKMMEEQADYFTYISRHGYQKQKYNVES